MIGYLLLCPVSILFSPTPPPPTSSPYKEIQKGVTPFKYVISTEDTLKMLFFNFTIVRTKKQMFLLLLVVKLPALLENHEIMTYKQTNRPGQREVSLSNNKRIGDIFPL